jgi:sporulation protein YtfJ
MDNSAKISDIIRSALGVVHDLVDTGTIVGEPIKTDDGTTIIPIVKVSVGIASGGLEKGASRTPAGEKLSDKTLAALGANFTGGGGTGLTMSPVGFLVVKNTGAVEILSLAAANSTSTTVDIIDRAADFIERSPELLKKLKGLFGGKEKKAAASDDTDGEMKD